MVRDMKSGAKPGGRCFWIHCREWLENAGDYRQYKRFMSRADKNFILRAEGRPDVPCHLSMSSVTWRSQQSPRTGSGHPAGRIRQDGQGRGVHAPPGQRSEGLRVEGARWAGHHARVASYDLSCVLEKHDTLACRGYLREDAARIGLNVVLYSLQQ